ncbi:hypothetical protein [Bradyrhizobium erythrophlei]|uniref:Phage shock protein B n=1 Tax=Bradyrhizobium erythrophlei TaxID=1437360 RepID=A0A1H5HE67_9BRAD|nr:hypothetical protein [Bradyrhizobium erythrophlei]GIQ75045.1 hypothetical protein BraRD5C2_34860 [Bradyrhizobium sp. RD5-C2]SEE25568.1 hypothetical protein SAMN05444164_7441 [Bradyrhizobium erythrophlei]
MHGDWISVLLSWWPFVMLIGAYILIVRLNRQRSASGLTAIELCEQQVAETQRTNAILEKIAAALHKDPVN